MLRQELDKKQESDLLSWESERKNKYQQVKQQHGEQSQENLVKDMAERVSAALQLLRTDSGDDSSQLQEMFYALTEQMGDSSQELKERLSALEAQMGRSSQELEGRLSTVELQMGRSSQELEGRLSTMEVQMGCSSQELKGRLSTMEEQMGLSSQELTGRLSTIEEQMGCSSKKLEGRLSTIEEQMSWIVSALKENVISSRRPSLVPHPSSMASQLLTYPDTDVTRYPVPDKLVPLKEQFPGYEPPVYDRYQKDSRSRDPAAEDNNLAEERSSSPLPLPSPPKSSSSSGRSTPSASQMIAPRDYSQGGYREEEGEETSPDLGNVHIDLDCCSVRAIEERWRQEMQPQQLFSFSNNSADYPNSPLPATSSSPPGSSTQYASQMIVPSDYSQGGYREEEGEETSPDLGDVHIDLDCCSVRAIEERRRQEMQPQRLFSADYLDSSEEDATTDE